MTNLQRTSGSFFVALCTLLPVAAWAHHPATPVPKPQPRVCRLEAVVVPAHAEVVSVPVKRPGHYREVFVAPRCASRQYGSQPRCLPGERRRQWVQGTTAYVDQTVWVPSSVRYLEVC